MNRVVGTVILICVVLLSGWLLGCGVRTQQKDAAGSEREAVTEDVDPRKVDQPRPAIPRKRAQPLMYAMTNDDPRPRG